MALHIGQAIRKILTDNAAVSALVGTRIFALHVPQNKGYETQDRIVYSIVSEDHEHTLDAAVGYAHATVQLDIYSETYQGAKALAEKVRLALDGRKLTTVTVGADSMLVGYVHLNNAFDGFDGPTDGSDQIRPVVTHDYRCGYNVTEPTFV